eukprot:5066262-Amphidinium_carterae.1
MAERTAFGTSLRFSPPPLRTEASKRVSSAHVTVQLRSPAQQPSQVPQLCASFAAFRVTRTLSAASALERGTRA